MTEYMTCKKGLSTTTFTHDGSAMDEQKKYKYLSYYRKQYSNKRVILLGRDIKRHNCLSLFSVNKKN